MKVILDLNLKEFMFHLFQSKACNLILSQRSPVVDSGIMASIYHIKQHFNQSIRIADLANIACMSESKFFRSFKDYFGCSPLEYITLERLKRSKDLLKRTTAPISEIAFDVGFNSLEHFHRTFKAHNNATPNEFRKNLNRINQFTP